MLPGKRGRDGGGGIKQRARNSIIGKVIGPGVGRLQLFA